MVQEIEKDETIVKKNISEKPTTKKDNLPVYQPPLPHPQRFLKKKRDEQFAKFLGIFKKININIQFFDALEEMPNYVKFVKEVLSKKRKFEDYETVKLIEEFFKKLGLGEVKPTTIILQLADRSFTYPRGVIEDVLVKVDKIVFPVNFVVLDMEKGHEIPLIIGLHFLATGGALIDVQEGHLTLRVNEEKVRFYIYKSVNWPVTMNTCRGLNHSLF
ncbi:uncharacterized protein LOC133832632 [Humulus lupulus]|uniref:uncharacterized protein LOC133832632 n=1 Tax=Humulus lupulus TaxID=3486 RepID=UPI002B4102BD|nr:uncharacterized protein LOC133832632 [Humulus lupulus]